MRFPALPILLLLTGIAAANASDAGDWRVVPAPDQYVPPETRNLPPAAIRGGTGAVEGMTGKEAFYVTVASGLAFARVSTGNVERRLSLAGWQGKRVRIALRFKTLDGISALASAIITTSNNASIRVQAPGVGGRGNWQSSQMVVDVPGNAEDLVVDVRLYGRGTLWIEDLALEAVDDAVATARISRVPVRVPGDTGPIRDFETGNENPPGVINTINGH